MQEMLSGNKMKFLTNDELSHLNYFELCLYISLLDKLEESLGEEE